MRVFMNQAMGLDVLGGERESGSGTARNKARWRETEEEARKAGGGHRGFEEGEEEGGQEGGELPEPDAEGRRMAESEEVFAVLHLKEFVLFAVFLLLFLSLFLFSSIFFVFGFPWVFVLSSKAVVSLFFLGGHQQSRCRCWLWLLLLLSVAVAVVVVVVAVAVAMKLR